MTTCAGGYLVATPGDLFESEDGLVDVQVSCVPTDNMYSMTGTALYTAPRLRAVGVGVSGMILDMEPP